MKKLALAMIILSRGLLLLAPAYLISAYALNLLGQDLNQAYLLFIDGSPLMEGLFAALKQIIGCVVFSAFLWGVKSGCEYASGEAIFEKNEISKIAYFIGIAPAILIIYLTALTPLIGEAYNGSILLLGSILFGIFITPKMTKNWLIPTA
jgi:hypothetical protein